LKRTDLKVKVSMHQYFHRVRFLTPLGVIALAALAAACSTPAAPAPATTMSTSQPTMTDDPYLWLEDVDGERALAWVRAENKKTVDALASSSDFKRLEGDVRTILDSDARIPSVQKIGELYYNFWRDKQNPRGLWRRTTLAEYRKPNPAWETVLDVDALDATERKGWVWAGAECLKPDQVRCLVSLSPGGSDATVVREFDLSTKTWVPGGFEKPLAKGDVHWVDQDTLFIATDFGPGSLTSSGYARIAKRWKRGTPLSSAVTVYEGLATDVGVEAERDHTPGFVRDFVSRSLAFYNDELYLLGSDLKLTKIDAPNSAKKAVAREWLLLALREAWSVGGQTYAAGTLLATRLDAFMQGARRFDVLFEPTSSTSMLSMTVTHKHIVLNVLDDVKSSLRVMTPPAVGASAWQRSTIAGVPTLGQVSVAAVDSDRSDDLWLNVTDFLTPPQLMLARAGGGAQDLIPLKSSPTFFDATKHQVTQHFATSKDGTRVPYFLVAPKNLTLNSSTPTLLYGYGGFEVSQLPRYAAGVGKGWLEKGGAYVVANIRGGGEYGPRWHQAALKANRPRSFEDFAAVAQDLVARKVTSPKRLAMRGGSNGGLLMGAMLTQYPDSFGAVSIEVPLLDMKRYTKLLAGASWIAEYGDPDKADEWAFIQTWSPYHRADASKAYPPTLLLTSTKDDRVHPGHARKMAALLLSQGKDVRYYENIEGGHGGAANNAQAAFMAALSYQFLWQSLER
jgi:prolyl oligopeptidase